MNIKITDSWLREHLKTKATAQEIGRYLSMSAVSVEKIDKVGDDLVYDLEVTANRPDLMSVVGIAREAATALKEAGIAAEFIPLDTKTVKLSSSPFPVNIEVDEKIINRVIAVVMEVAVKDSPQYIKDRLEATGIRSLNNLIDVTNYVMREVGHPTHVFDFDRLNTEKIILRESKKGEKIITLDGKEHILHAGDIVADNGKGEIVDLLAVMGTANSVVTDKTKRIMFFIDNNDPHKIRKTSMTYGIRTEAAIINEKGIDPDLAMDAMLFGIKLYEEVAEGKPISKIFDDYPNKRTSKKIKVLKVNLDKIIGVEIPLRKAAAILTNLDFKVEIGKEDLIVTPPSIRAGEVTIEEDVIEEVARIYGYSKIPNELPPLNEVEKIKEEDNVFYWENRAKQALKYWGFTEAYTYSFVSEDLLEGPANEAIEIANPLSKDTVFMRKTLVPSLLQVVEENKKYDQIKIFEIANIYKKRLKDLPEEILTLAGVIKNPNINFFEIKGIIEQLLNDFGIKNFMYEPTEKGGLGASVYIGKDYLGEIEILPGVIDFELNFEKIIKNASLKKVFKPFSKFPPVFEDLAIIADSTVLTNDIINTIENQSNLITDVYLLDQYKDSRTFHVVYQSEEKNLTSQDIKEIRGKIIAALEKNFKAKLKN